MASMASASAAATSKESVNPPAGPSSATNSKGTFCATVIITCCSLALGPRLTSQTLLPGTCFARFGGFVEGVAGPGVEHRRQHHLVLERRPGRARDRFQRLQRVGDNAPADNDMEWLHFSV